MNQFVFVMQMHRVFCELATEFSVQQFRLMPVFKEFSLSVQLVMLAHRLCCVEIPKCVRATYCAFRRAKTRASPLLADQRQHKPQREGKLRCFNFQPCNFASCA